MNNTDEMLDGIENASRIYLGVRGLEFWARISPTDARRLIRHVDGDIQFRKDYMDIYLG